MKKILILHGSNDLYGASKVLLNIVDCFNTKGYKVHVILPFRGDLDNKLIQKVDRISHYNLGVLRKKYFNIKGILKRTFLIIKSTNYINQYVKKNEINLIYTNTSVVLPGLISSKLMGIDNIVHIHEIPYGSNIYNFILGNLINFLCKKVIVVSKKVFDHWGRFIKKENISVVYNYSQMTNSKKIILNDNKITISNFSRIVPQKGIIYFLKIAAQLVKTDNKYFFKIVGNPLTKNSKYFLQVKSFVKKNNLTNHVSFLGFIENPSNIISESSLILHTPIFPDSLPTILIEGMSLGVPVCSTNQGGVSEILNFGNNGLIINNFDHAKAALSIKNYLNNYELIEKHKNNSRKFLKKNFSKSVFEKKINKILVN